MHSVGRSSEPGDPVRGTVAPAGPVVTAPRVGNRAPAQPASLARPEPRRSPPGEVPEAGRERPTAKQRRRALETGTPAQAPGTAGPAQTPGHPAAPQDPEEPGTAVADDFLADPTGRNP